MPTTIVIPARFENLKKICDFVDNFAIKAGFDEVARYSIQTAVDEACSNIIDHAYGGEDLGDIECMCKVDPTHIEIKLTDHGHAFDPGMVIAPDLTSPIDFRKERGLGLYFMRKMMDEIHFDFSSESENILTMVKYKEIVS